jgi:hypothetical protein
MTARQLDDVDTYIPRPSWLNCQRFDTRGGVTFKPIHGTIAGARWHHRQGELPCGDCRHAASEYRAQFPKTKRRKKVAA